MKKENDEQRGEIGMKPTYLVKTIHQKEDIEQCNPFSIQQYMWDSKQKPKVQGWMGYLEGEGIYVKMICQESNPKRCYQNHNDAVYEDSAMEIFLAFLKEGEELSNECMYTNFEINANGAMLAQKGKGRKNRSFLEIERIESTGVSAKIAEKEWSIEVLFPETCLDEICDFGKIKAGEAFYCNFYKIAESEEILHFGSFSPIDSETPNFHMPVCFAKAMIEK